jgi:hypothetical protein
MHPSEFNKRVEQFGLKSKPKDEIDDTLLLRNELDAANIIINKFKLEKNWINNMNEQEINEACAKLDNKTCSNCGGIQCGCAMVEIGSSTPSYTTSYDAIIPLMQKENAKTKVKILDSVLVDDFNNDFELDATPLQLAISLLKAKGLWKK